MAGDRGGCHRRAQRDAGAGQRRHCSDPGSHRPPVSSSCRRPSNGRRCRLGPRLQDPVHLRQCRRYRRSRPGGPGSRRPRASASPAMPSGAGRPTRAPRRGRSRPRSGFGLPTRRPRSSTRSRSRCAPGPHGLPSHDRSPVDSCSGFCFVGLFVRWPVAAPRHPLIRFRESMAKPPGPRVSGRSGRRAFLDHLASPEANHLNRRLKNSQRLRDGVMRRPTNAVGRLVLLPLVSRGDESTTGLPDSPDVCGPPDDETAVIDPAGRPRP